MKVEMSNVVAINQVSAEAVEEMQKEVMRDEFKAFVQNDPEVRQMMIERVKTLISGLSSWDIEYHSNFKDVTAEILKSEAVKPLLEGVIVKCLESEKTPDYRVFEAIGQCIAERLKLELVK